MQIQWYPGHMAKAQRMLREQIRLVDVVIELRDARIPVSSANPVLAKLVAARPVLVVLNKAALAEREPTQRWLRWFSRAGNTAVAVDTATGQGWRDLTAALATLRQTVSSRRILRRPLRAMVAGIPNVGKSTLVNKLTGAAKTRTGAKPGVTRAPQWLRATQGLELLDTPGVLWPKLDDEQAAFKLAVTGAIPETVVDSHELASGLVLLLARDYPARLAGRYGLATPPPADSGALLQAIAVNRGLLQKGGAADLARTTGLVLQEFRTGRLGPFTLDPPPACGINKPVL